MYLNIYTYNYNYNQMDVIEISKKIFSNSIQPANSIQLDFSESEDLTTKDIFEILLIMFQQAMIIHYGDRNGRVDLSKITETDFNKIDKYFNSFDFTVRYEIRPIDYVEEYIEKKSLKDYFLRIVSNNITYYISFDNYISNTNCKNL